MRGKRKEVMWKLKVGKISREERPNRGIKIVLVVNFGLNE